ncbi:MAG: M17 family peptidase N-terminal domain-containing protein, partial [Prochlorococcaceae cyanobacterium]
MEFRCLPTALAEITGSWSGDALAVGLFAEADHPFRQQLGQLFGGVLLEHLEARRFKGKAGESVCIERLGQSPASLILVGLGEAAGFHLNGLREASAAAARVAAKVAGRQLGLVMPVEGLGAEAAAAAMAEAVRLSLYSDQRFRSETEPAHRPQQVDLLGLPESAWAGLGHVDALCSGVELARRLVAAPPNVATPAGLAEAAAAIAADFGLELK